MLEIQYYMAAGEKSDGGTWWRGGAWHMEEEHDATSLDVRWCTKFHVSLCYSPLSPFDEISLECLLLSVICVHYACNHGPGLSI